MNCDLCGRRSKEKGKGESAPRKLVAQRHLASSSRHSRCSATNYLRADFPFPFSFERLPRRLNEQHSFVLRLQARHPKGTWEFIY